jgi:hypothetical protein
MLRGAPKYFLALKGGSESSRYTGGGLQTFQNFGPVGAKSVHTSELLTPTIVT